MSDAENKVYSWQVLYRYCEDVFLRMGLTPDDARTMADSLVDANLRGVDSHGVVRVPIYFERLQKGVAKARPDMRVIVDTPATAVLDADTAMGQVASVKGMDLAIAKAKSTGAGFVTIRKSEHFGAAAYFALRAASHGMIGFAMSNTTPGMAAWGGAEPILGNNPFAIAVPAGDDYPHSIVVDMATSVVAWGKILIAAGKGEKIPTHWALDAEGAPTSDPQAAMEGVLLPFGEHKGFGIALAIEILTGVLSGSNFGSGLPHMYKEFDRPFDAGQMVGALNVESFMPMATFKERLDELARQIHSSKPAKGVERVLLPGEIEWKRAEERRTAGIPLSAAVISDLTTVGKNLGVEFPA